MDEFVRLLVTLTFAGAALTALGALAIRLADERRRMRRALKKVLKAQPHALLLAHGRGRGAGFNFNSDQIAVTWDSGGWCLVYRVDELVGAELLIDGQVAARAHRGEPRRPIELICGADEEVRLRLIFSDPRYPDFDLVLWRPQDEGGRGGRSAAEAVHEANSWVTRIEALFRRPTASKAAIPLAAARAPEPEPEDEPELAFDEDEDEEPAWEEEAEDAA